MLKHTKDIEILLYPLRYAMRYGLRYDRFIFVRFYRERVIEMIGLHSRSCEGLRNVV